MPDSVEILGETLTFDQDRYAFLTRAILLARASELAYQSSAALIAEQLEVPSIATFNENRTRGFWFTRSGIALLVFRGTVDLHDWRENFRFSPPYNSNHDWGSVHPGFYDGVQHVIEPVLRPFAEAAKDMPHRWVSGHSLGGAIAVLAAVWLKLNASMVCDLSTYGQPMPGFENFTGRFDRVFPGRLTRIINKRDIVPRLPGAGYAHCGVSKTITSSGTLQKLGASPSYSLSDEDAVPATSDELNAFLLELETLDNAAFDAAQLEGKIGSRIPWLEHHRIGNYVLELESIRRSIRTSI